MGESDLSMRLDTKAGAPIERPKTNNPMELNKWRFGYLLNQGYKILGIIYPEEVSEAMKKYSKFGTNVMFGVGAYYDSCRFHKNMRVILKRD